MKSSGMADSAGGGGKKVSASARAFCSFILASDIVLSLHLMSSVGMCDRLL